MNLTAQQQQLVADNQGLAISLVTQYVRQYPKLEYLREDLIQEALLGLAMAAEKFQEAKGKFSTYAYFWMKAQVREYARRSLNPASGAPGYQRHGAKAVYLHSAPLEDWDHPRCEIDVVGLDARRLATRVQHELVGRMVESTESKNPERDVAVFLAGVCETRTGMNQNTAAKEPWAGTGMTRQRIEQIRKRVRPLFEALAADYRSEAA